MKKGLKLSGIIVAGLLVFGVGNFVGASSNWKVVLDGQISKEIGNTGFNKKEEITQRDIAAEMKTALDPEINAQEAQLEQLLEEYYQMKLQGMQESDEYIALENRITEIRNSIFNRYKTDIDKMFESM